MRFKDMKLGKKMALAFGIIFILIAVSSVVTTYMLRTIGRQAAHVGTESLPFALMAGEMSQQVTEVQQWLTDVAASHNEEGFKEAETAADGFKQNLLKFKAMFAQENDTESLNKIDAMAAAFDQYFETGAKMAHVYIKEGVEAGNRLMETFDQVAQTIKEKMKYFQEEQVGEAKKLTAGIKRSAGKASSRLIFINLAAMFIGILTLDNFYTLIISISRIKLQR